ncbi:zinc transporter, putative [Ixodes scapularis]|uniref:Zinc transporter, putative n=1 Tax=Ixodes scapularis TaxID=6945 RepID=B7PSH2_IXOSC|nr:zinc transporter, putative [Ixodes scapularis]|eukprot:XP_002402609.1 zinc transporter, putative [Ixodes scapularis]
MADAAMLFALAGAMFLGSYISGLVPLSLPLTEARLHLVSVFGAGLLVGTALSVIIPEGISTLYTTQMRRFHHDRSSTRLAGGPTPLKSDPAAPHGGNHGGLDELDPRNLVGVTLVLGFLFMLLVDQLVSRHRHSKVLPTSVSGESSVTATLGLIVHAAADGVALGAAATTSNLDTEAVVFLAIMLHKAPAAFALVSFLMHEAVERTTIRKHLLIFSLAAPLLALITFFAINRGATESISSLHATGVALLFSAGTFLYVATVHVLPELVVRHSNHQGDARGRSGTPSSDGFTKTDVLTIVVGALMPVLLTLGRHGH